MGDCGGYQHRTSAHASEPVQPEHQYHDFQQGKYCRYPAGDRYDPELREMAQGKYRVPSDKGDGTQHGSRGSVLVDISNDEQGAIETFHETTHENPRYVEEGVVHYCVSNIPGAIANSTSVAYAASVLPHFRSILNNGVAQACAKDGS